MKKILFLLLICIALLLPVNTLARGRYRGEYGSDWQRGEREQQKEFNRERERGQQRFEEERQNDRLRKLEKRLPDDQFKTFDRKFGE